MTHGWRRPGGWLIAGLAALASSPSPPARGQVVPVFTSEVDLITVDAVVLDSDGKPVSGLTRDDFQVSEDGAPVEIASFEAFALDPAPEVPNEVPAVASNTDAPGTSGRAFALIVDDLRMEPGFSQQARSAAESFLDTVVRPGDEVVLGTTSGDAWWTARTRPEIDDLRAVLSRVQGLNAVQTLYDRMSEYEAYRIANFEDKPSPRQTSSTGLSFSLPARAAAAAGDVVPSAALGSVRERVVRRWMDVGLCAGPSCDAVVRARAQEIDSIRRGRRKAVLRAIRQGLEALAPIHGRKSLVFFSEGFLDDPLSGGHRDVAAASREANVAVYFIDVRGLMTQSALGSTADAGAAPDPYDRERSIFEDSVLASAGARSLADDTGGFSVRNSNNFVAGARRIGEESRVFYLLGFYPPEGKKPREWRRLEVRVKRPGLTVRARRGYTLARKLGEPEERRKSNEGTPPELAPELARAVNSPHDDADIPLRALSYVFEPRRQERTLVFVAVEFDARQLTFERVGRARKARAEMSLVARLRDQPRGFRHDDTLELILYEGETPGWRSHAREFLLPAGVAQVRVVLRDATSGATGAVTSRVEVPPAGSLRLSTPILTDQVDSADQENGRPQVVIGAHRNFAPEGPLFVEFEVFGAAASDDGRPRVSAALFLWSQDRRLVRQAPASPIAPSADGRLVRFVGMDVQDLEDGPYQLVLEVEDRVSGARVTRVEPFRLARGTGPVS